MVDRRQKSPLPIRLRNHNPGQLGDGFDQQDLRKTAGRGQTGTGSPPDARFQFYDPVEEQKGVTVGEIMCRIGIKQGSLR